LRSRFAYTVCGHQHALLVCLTSLVEFLLPIVWLKIAQTVLRLVYLHQTHGLCYFCRLIFLVFTQRQTVFFANCFCHTKPSVFISIYPPVAGGCGVPILRSGSIVRTLTASEARKLLISLRFYPMRHRSGHRSLGSMPASLRDCRAASMSWSIATLALRFASTSCRSRQPALFLRKKIAAEVLGLSGSVAELNS